MRSYSLTRKLFKLVQQHPPSERLIVAALQAPYIQHSESPMALPEVIKELRRAAAEITAAIGGRLG